MKLLIENKGEKIFIDKNYEDGEPAIVAQFLAEVNLTMIELSAIYSERRPFKEITEEERDKEKNGKKYGNNGYRRQSYIG